METTAIVPIFNEEKTIKNVLTTLNNSNLIDKIIVVDDSSTDNSLKEVNNFISQKLKIISIKKNAGKSDAIKAAAKNLETDILFLCDGDLHNFKEEHIKQILKPFEHETIAMSVGIRDYGYVMNFLSKYFIPLLTGERALSYSIFKDTMQNPFMKDYGLELVLNDYCKIKKIPVHKNIMAGLKQTIKYKKWKNGAYLLTKQTLQLSSLMLILNIMRIIKK